MRKRALCSLAFLLLVSLTLTAAGCWDQAPIDSLGLIIGYGIDLNKENPDLFDFTWGHSLFQDTKRSAVRLITTSGPNLLIAAQQWQLQHDLTIVPGKTKLILLGEEVAKRGAINFLDYLENPETDDSAFVALARGRAEDVIRSPVLETERVITHIATLLERSERVGCTPAERVGEVVSRYAVAGVDPILPIVGQSTGKDVILIVGAALMRDMTMVGELSPDENRVLCAIASNHALVIYSPAVGITNEIYEGFPEIRMIRPKAKIKPTMQNGRLKVEIDFESDYWLRWVATNADLSKSQDTKAITEDIESALILDIQKVMAKLQEAKVDPLGIGLKMRVKDHKNYDDNEFREKWSNAELEIKVKLTYIRPGTLIKSQFDQK